MVGELISRLSYGEIDLLFVTKKTLSAMHTFENIEAVVCFKQEQQAVNEAPRF